jgi:hypothetical protein
MNKIYVDLDALLAALNTAATLSTIIWIWKPAMCDGIDRGAMGTGSHLRRIL